MAFSLVFLLLPCSPCAARRPLAFSHGEEWPPLSRYTPEAVSRFYGTERLNRALTGLCDASLATRLLSAMLFKVCVCRALA